MNFSLLLAGLGKQSEFVPGEAEKLSRISGETAFWIYITAVFVLVLFFLFVLKKLISFKG